MLIFQQMQRIAWRSDPTNGHEFRDHSKLNAHKIIISMFSADAHQAEALQGPQPQQQRQRVKYGQGKDKERADALLERPEYEMYKDCKEGSWGILESQVKELEEAVGKERMNEKDQWRIKQALQRARILGKVGHRIFRKGWGRILTLHPHVAAIAALHRAGAIPYCNPGEENPSHAAPAPVDPAEDDAGWLLGAFAPDEHEDDTGFAFNLGSQWDPFFC
jgi:hypothetical protein